MNHSQFTSPHTNSMTMLNSMPSTPPWDAPADSSALTYHLQHGSLLLSIVGEDIRANLVCHLSAQCISTCMSTCTELRVTLREEVSLRLRGRPPGTSLRLLARAEEALLFECFCDDVWTHWLRGPSAPPTSRPAYNTLGVSAAPNLAAAPDSLTLLGSPAPCLGSSAVDFTLRLEPGCLALLRDGSTVVLVARYHGYRRWRVYRLDSLGDELIEDGPNLRLVSHRGWEGPPSQYLRLHGGWRMNFSGVVRSFETPLRPTRISFSVRVRAGCHVRSFFNFFLSSIDTQHKDLAAFYAGNASFAPQPADTFTFLMGTQTEAGGTTTSRPMLWLPSGDTAELSAGLSVGEWHQVSFILDWDRMVLLLFVDGCNYGTDVRGPRLLSFAPHRSLDARAESTEADTPTDAARMSRHIHSGFRHLYLFTWVADDDAQGADPAEMPDVDLGNIIFE